MAANALLRALGAAALVMGAASTTAIAQSSSADYLRARHAAYYSDYETAAEAYARALARDPSNMGLMESAATSSLNAGDFDAAVAVARRMRGAGSESQIASMILMAGAVAAGEYGAVSASIAEGHRVGPLIDGLATGWAAIGSGDTARAMMAFDAVSAARGLESFGRFHKGLALAHLGEFEAAEAIFDNDGQPLRLTRRGAEARVQILSNLGRQSDAIFIIDRLFGADLDPGLRQMREVLEAGGTIPFTVVEAPADGIAEAYYTVAAALRGEAADGYTLLYARIAEHLSQGHVDAILMSATLLEGLGRHEQATEVYARIPEGHGAWHSAELGRAAALRKAGRPEAAIEALSRLADLYPAMPRVQIALGDALRSQKRHELAIEAYDRALALEAELDRRSWRTFYARGISRERSGDWQGALSDLNDALALRPEDPRILNFLGYGMVEQGGDLDVALDLIERAVEADPDSGYIVDSLGWAQYRLGMFEEAVTNLERAVALMPVDPTINDHLGDAYWMTGRQREARFQWSRALSFEPEDGTEDRIRRKLEVGLDTVLIEEGADPAELARSE